MPWHNVRGQEDLSDRESGDWKVKECKASVTLVVAPKILRASVVSSPVDLDDDFALNHQVHTQVSRKPHLKFDLKTRSDQRQPSIGLAGRFRSAVDSPRQRPSRHLDPSFEPVEFPWCEQAVMAGGIDRRDERVLAQTPVRLREYFHTVDCGDAYRHFGHAVEYDIPMRPAIIRAQATRLWHFHMDGVAGIDRGNPPRPERGDASGDSAKHRRGSRGGGGSRKRITSPVKPHYRARAHCLAQRISGDSGGEQRLTTRRAIKVHKRRNRVHPLRMLGG